MELLPAVDVLDGRVVRLHQGDYERATDYGADIVGQASAWMHDGARMVHVVDLDGARHGRPSIDLWHALGDAGIPFQVGGGIRTVADARNAVTAGALRVMMGTAAVWEPDVLAGAVAELGADAVMASVDVSSGRARGAGWRDDGQDVESVLEGCQAAGIIRYLVTAVSRDGTMTGPDLELIRTVQVFAPEAAILAAGGIGALEDLRSLAELGIEGAVIGRALYEGAFTLRAALEVIAERG